MASFLSTRPKENRHPNRGADFLSFGAATRRLEPTLAAGSNLKAKRKRLRTVFAKLFANKQGVCRAECTEARADDYAAGESCRLQKKALRKKCFFQ